MLGFGAEFAGIVVRRDVGKKDTKDGVERGDRRVLCDTLVQ
jgi:hypothetical protein